ncbi:MAG: hypothetical protein R2860_13865 [Desulfobacterales bacterium]
MKSDVLSLKVRLAQAEEALVESHNRCKLARRLLLISWDLIRELRQQVWCS